LLKRKRGSPLLPESYQQIDRERKNFKHLKPSSSHRPEGRFRKDHKRRENCEKVCRPQSCIYRAQKVHSILPSLKETKTSIKVASIEGRKITDPATALRGGHVSREIGVILFLTGKILLKKVFIVFFTRRLKRQ